MVENYTNAEVLLITLLLFNSVFWIGVFIYGFVRALRALKKNRSEESFFTIIFGVSAIQGFLSYLIILTGIDDEITKGLLIFPLGIGYLIFIVAICCGINYLLISFSFSLLSMTSSPNKKRWS